jgi:hypothetical protein
LNDGDESAGGSWQTAKSPAADRWLALPAGKGWYVWNNTGDKATSRDSSGALKDTCTWGDGSGIRYC